MTCYNFDTHKWILIFFGRNVTNKVGNQKTLYYVTSNSLCFCTTWQNGETRKSHFSPNWTVLHAQCTCVRCLPERKKIVIAAPVINCRLRRRRSARRQLNRRRRRRRRRVKITVAAVRRVWRGALILLANIRTLCSMP